MEEVEEGERRMQKIKEDIEKRKKESKKEEKDVTMAKWEEEQKQVWNFYFFVLF